MDEANLNAQNLNARSFLSRFSGEKCEWHSVYYRSVDRADARNCAIRVTRLAPWRAWPWHLALFYQKSADAIFYPGLEWFDQLGLRWRDRTSRSVPIIATLEGLPGRKDREERLSCIAGHPVHCMRIAKEALERFDYVMHRADHIVAISPFLAKMARNLYGDKCSVLPLGVDLETFSPARDFEIEANKKSDNSGKCKFSQAAGGIPDFGGAVSQCAVSLDR